jgi:hypothetical protein
MMVSFTEWFPPALTGTLLTLMGSVKLFGLARGIQGGRDKPAMQRLCST